MAEVTKTQEVGIAVDSWAGAIVSLSGLMVEVLRINLKDKPQSNPLCYIAALPGGPAGPVPVQRGGVDQAGGGGVRPAGGDPDPGLTAVLPPGWVVQHFGQVML